MDVTTALLHERLCGADSATDVIGDLFGRPVTIRRIACEAPVLTPSQSAALAPTPEQPALHRRVLLLARGVPVSEADLWYVPARLWPGMAEKLRDSDTPFGLVVRRMNPRRETLATQFCEPGGEYVLEHEAVLRDVDGRPIALVLERYVMQLIA